MRAKDALGRYGEQVAAAHLTDAGLTILARNWRCRDGELDIVAAEGPTLVVCEVKTRSSTAFGDPAEAVDRRKVVRLRHLALCWLGEQRGTDSRYWPEIRFDVISVLRAKRGAAQVNHVRGAFQ